MAAQQYEIVIEDQLQWASVPLASKAAQATAAEGRRQKLFQARWVEKNGFDKPDDIDRFLTKATSIAGDAREKEHGELAALAMYSARNTVCLDRDRRVAFGYIRPPLKSVLDGRDGGVDTHRYRRRRHRPDGTQRRSQVAGLPHSRIDTASKCLVPESSQFDSGSVVESGVAKLGSGIKPRWSVYDGRGGAAGGVGASSPSDGQERIRRHRLRAVDDIMRNQPTNSTVYAALRRLVGSK